MVGVITVPHIPVVGVITVPHIPVVGVITVPHNPVVGDNTDHYKSGEKSLTAFPMNFLRTDLLDHIVSFNITESFKSS